MTAILLGVTACVVAVDESVTIDDPVDRIEVDVTAGDVSIHGVEGPVRLTGAFGGAGHGPIGHHLDGTTLIIRYDCRWCGGQLTIEAPPDTALSLAVGAGDLTIDAMDAEVDAGLTGGNATVLDHGPGPVTVDLELGSADLTFGEPPSRAEIHASTGAIALTVPSGPYALDLDAARGSVEVDPELIDDPDSPNALIASTGTGSITLRGR